MADQSGLSSRAIIGRFYARLEADFGTSWISRLGMMFQSDQESETYKWLGQTPAMREWVGGRQAKGLRENGITITNKKYESTLEIERDDLMRDKTGQINVRINEQADRANSHWAKLMTTLIENGESTVCYDGQFFFDTDHSEGASGTQSNDLSGGVFNVTDPNDPTADEMAKIILYMIQQMYSFKDDQGEPMNELAQEFLVMVPTPFYAAAKQAVSSNLLDTGAGTRDNVLRGMNITLVQNARLTWTTKLAVFRTDASAKPFILQEEEGVRVQAVAEGSELEFNEDVHHYGITAKRNVGYGYWQYAMLGTLS